MATDDVAAEQQREEKRQARLLDLTKADIVLTTYQALRREVHYASDFTGGGSHVRSLRYAKKYSVPTCPLLSFGWHRVVLDEERSTSGTIFLTNSHFPRTANFSSARHNASSPHLKLAGSRIN